MEVGWNKGPLKKPSQQRGRLQKGGRRRRECQGGRSPWSWLSRELRETEFWEEPIASDTLGKNDKLSQIFEELVDGKETKQQ